MAYIEPPLIPHGAIEPTIKNGNLSGFTVRAYHGADVVGRSWAANLGIALEALRKHLEEPMKVYEREYSAYLEKKRQSGEQEFQESQRDGKSS